MFGFASAGFTALAMLELGAAITSTGRRLIISVKRVITDLVKPGVVLPSLADLKAYAKTCKGRDPLVEPDDLCRKIFAKPLNARDRYRGQLFHTLSCCREEARNIVTDTPDSSYNKDDVRLLTAMETIRHLVSLVKTTECKANALHRILFWRAKACHRP